MVDIGNNWLVVEDTHCSEARYGCSGRSVPFEVVRPKILGIYLLLKYQMVFLLIIV